jgi:RimJ/RimL family protein N-acetyltransferase
MSSAAESLVIRPIEERDLALLEPWLLASGLGVPEELRGRDWRARLLRDPRIRCRIGCGSGGLPVGFYRLDLAPDRTGEITLVVARAHRRRGHGTELLDAALAEARRLGLRRLVAMVEEDNPVARNFFLAAGFEPSGRPVPRFVPLERLVHGADAQPPLEISP